MARNFVFAGISGLGDSPGDAALISGGFNDAKACEPPVSSTPSTPQGGNDAPGNTGAPAGGWTGGSISPPAGCTGACGGGGSLVNVTDPVPVQTSK